MGYNFTIPALIFDLVLAGVLAFTAFSYTRKGFASGIVKLLGNLMAILVSLFTSNKVSPILFDRFFRDSLITRTQETISQQGVPYLQGLVEDIASFLPADFVKSTIEKATTAIDTQSATLAQDIVEFAVKPLFVPVIAVVLFFIMYTVCRIIITQLSAALINVNKIPLLGGVNKLLGLVTGVLCGVLEVIIILCALWALITLTNNGLPVFNDNVLRDSLFYSTFSSFNPFLKL